MGFLELLIESAAILSATELMDLFETQSGLNCEFKLRHQVLLDGSQLIKTFDKVALPQYWARVLMKGDI